jgi:hypothetical protein
LSENRQVLKRFLQEQKVRNKPILMYKTLSFEKYYEILFLSFFSLANKQDKTEAHDKKAIVKNLEIEQFINDNQTLCRVVKTITFFVAKNVFD